MPHAGIAFMVVVGIGLGAILYYMFADGERQQYGNAGSGYNSPPPEHFDPWTSNQDNNKTRRRKRGSNVSTGKISCTICLVDMVEEELVYRLPCRHEFHKKCIAEWREQGPLEARNTCPNCRVGISGSSV